MTRKRTAMILGGALGVMAAALVLAVALNDGGTAEAHTPPVTYWKVSMPDLGQHSTGWCWAGAAADSFWWYADNVDRQEGLLGGAADPWKAIDPASMTPASPCGVGGTWYDSRDLPDVSQVFGYPTILKKIAEATFKDLNQNGVKDFGENNYCFSEGVEKWDYLIGLRDFAHNYGVGLAVHDIIDPTKCGVGVGYIVNRAAPTMNTRNPCGPGNSGVPGVNQTVRPPMFLDYMTELSASQDVLLWLEPVPGYAAPETAHVVAGVGYDSNLVGAFGLGTVTISDPWTHTTNAAVPPAPVPAVSHNDLIPPLWQPKPDHNTSDAHGVYPGSTDPYNRCDVKQLLPNLQIQCYGEDAPPFTPHVWRVVDMIFVSPLSVGGLAELPDVASDSGWPAGAYAALAGAIAAAVLALGGGAWYARRRWVK